ncbi:MAG: 50S ribosomal protein L23 [Bdellovibrionaceae bacterium]|nr:50S ribosomal protein L23 [Pseudobdellovibrionaceae bacterium]|tara:strand:+ start:35576 stop:35854 length:279 start_codon:yes stop_codon:yes gene_type:complete
MLHVIKRPLVSEKNSLLSEQGYYAFEVDRKATKTDVKKAIEKAFRVKVEKVTTQVCRGRSKRTKIGVSKVRYWKKALVKLPEGEKISIFEGV